jgi:membrane protein involved in colicin uptake
MGAVPAYLKARKKAWKEEDAAVDKWLADTHDAPAGCVLMPERDRLDRLAELRAQKAAIDTAFGSLSITSNTQRLRRHRAELELQASATEQLIANFSRPRVFVPL